VMPMTYFERHWELANYWAAVVLPPHQLAETAGELAHMRAASVLEAMGHLQAAKQAYEAVLERWPESLSAYIGLGNVAYQEKNYHESLRILRKAKVLFPESRAVENNLRVGRAVPLNLARWILNFGMQKS